VARAHADDVLSVFRFHVEAVGTFGQNYLGSGQAGFQSVTVPEISLDTVEYREGQHMWTKKLPGIPSTDTITLRRGVVRRDAKFFNWMMTVVLGQGSFRAELLIKHYSRSALDGSRIAVDAIPARIYQVSQAFPVRCKLAADFDASAGEVSVAELELAYEYVEMEVIE
jgi:phage tail-like protein